MKRIIISLLFSGFAVAFPVTAAAMNNQDVTKMLKAGLSEETIMAAMQKERPEYDTSSDALIELKVAGVSDKIIQLIVSLKPGAAPAPTTTAASGAASDSSPPPAPGSAPRGGSLLAPAPGPSLAPAMAAPDAFAALFPSIAPPVVAPVVGKDYFLRSSIRCEKSTYVGTNYARGDLIPINTPVRFVAVKGDVISLKRSDTGADVKLENIEKHTKKSTNEFASSLLSEEKTPLEKLPPEVANSILSGDMRKGMTKELVLMARGYPPAHETPSIEGDKWVYWSSRFVKHTVLFSNGRLTDGRGIN